MKTEGGGLLGRLRAGVRRTQARLGAALRRTDHSRETLEELEEALLGADVGVQTASALLEHIRQTKRRDADLRSLLADALVDKLNEVSEPGFDAFELPEGRPQVWLIVGVNGSGKTTTAGKLAMQARAGGLRVMLVAADTFRAAASEQLAIWAERVGARFVGSEEGGDAAAVLYDGVQAAAARGVDLVIVDTAGRLHTKTNLMQELEKVVRVAGKALPGAPHESFLVLDGTTGRNALQQARQFTSQVGVTGLIVTKIDGTAKGGAVIAIADELRLPVRFLGVGESSEDLLRFEARTFVAALLGE